MLSNFNRGYDIHKIALVRELLCEADIGVYVFTFGCQQNESDTEKIIALCEEMGYHQVDNFEDAGLIILNTCAIREHAEAKALSMLGSFKSKKRKCSNLTVVGVMGCMAAEKHVVEMLKNDFHYVDFALEPSKLHMLPSVLYSILLSGERVFKHQKDDLKIAEGLPIKRKCREKAYVSIMYGCNNFCSYCIVPYVRGRERSRASSDIILECKKAIDEGAKEIMLLGQNVNSYSSDMDFPSLLEAVATLEGDFKVSFMTSHPKDVSDELIRIMAQNEEKITRTFHLPLQSGSDSILKKMNRTYNQEQFLIIVDKLRRAMPNIFISTDVIVGFPGETEEDFLETIRVLNIVKFDMVYSFKYSRRKGTPADNYSEQVDDTVKKERLNRLLVIQDEILKEKNIIK